jgi:hypothetical protein
MLVEVGRHLKFFDKNGNELNLTRTHGVWYGMSYFPRVSSSLHEVQHLFIVEEVKYKEEFTQSIDLDALSKETATYADIPLTPDPTGSLGIAKILKPGKSFKSYDTSDASNYFVADILGYNETTGYAHIRIVYSQGSGSHSSWRLETFTYVHPRGDADSYFFFKWREYEFEKNIFLFQAETSANSAIIKRVETQDILLNNGSGDDIEGVTFSGDIPISVDSDATLYRIIDPSDDLNKKIMQVNIALHSDEESRFARTLEIYYKNLSSVESSEVQSFLGTGLQSQSFPFDVPEDFSFKNNSFDVYLIPPGSGTKLQSSSSLDLGSMSLTFESHKSIATEPNLSQNGDIVVYKDGDISKNFLCKIVYSEHDPVEDTTTVYIEDNAALSLVDDISKYRIAYSKQDVQDISVVYDITGYEKEESVVQITRRTPSLVTLDFGNSEHGIIPQQNSLIVFRCTPIENEQKVAEVAFYGEVEGEDERFKMLLQNLGMDIVPDVGPIFRGSDVNEILPDYLIVNEKRKELLAAGDHIFPYTGSYKGFINAIKFFGYGDLRLKEYWKNIDMQSTIYGKYRQVEVPLNLTDVNNDKLIPSQNWKKTNKFSLFYDINRLTGTYDEYGQPVTQDVFDFTNDEILIKLFSLKNVLKKYFLPLNARIVDITGEGVYFETYAIESWLTQNETITASPDYLDIDFTAEPSIAYIEDLGTGYRTDDNIGDGVKVQDLAQFSIQDIKDFELRSFYVNKSYSNFVDDSQANIGATVTLTANTFSVTWSDLKQTWKNMMSSEQELPGTQYSWKGIASKDAYEMEWRVKSAEREVPFTYRKRGKIEDLEVHDVVVPYEGNYDVTLAYYLTSSGSQSRTKKSLFQVLMKSTNIAGIYRASNKIELWTDVNQTWKQGAWSWAERNQGVLRPKRKRRSDVNSLYRSLKNTTWQNCGIRWKDSSVSSYLGKDEVLESIILPISEIDYNKSIVKISGNYFNPDEPNAQMIKSGMFVRFTVQENREGYKVKYYDSTQKLITIEGEHSESELYGKQISIISRKEIGDLTFYSMSTDLRYDGYRPRYMFGVTGDVTSRMRTNTSIEYKLYGQTSFNEGLIKQSRYDSDGNTTTIVFESLDERPFNFDPSELINSSRIESLENCSIRYFDFIARFLPGTITPYNGKTIIYASSQNNALSFIPDPNDPSNDIVAYWNNVDSDVSFYINGITYANGKTSLVLDDPFNNLRKIDLSYMIQFSDFDLDYAQEWYGVDAVSKWKSAKVRWQDSFSRTWGSFDYHSPAICGFKLNAVSPGGTIRVDSGELFEFPNTQFMTLGDAVEALRSSNDEGISKFNYSVALYDESIGLVRIEPYTILVEANDQYASFETGDVCFMLPGTPIDGKIQAHRSPSAKLVYLGQYDENTYAFRVLSVGTTSIYGEYKSTPYSKMSLDELSQGDYVIVEPASIGSNDFDGKVSENAVFYNNSSSPVKTDYYTSISYGFWPYYMSGGYKVGDAYVLSNYSDNGSVSQNVSFYFENDITSLPYFEIGKTIRIKSSDGTDTIELTISDASSFDPINAIISIPVEHNTDYQNVVDVTDYRVYFTEWAELQDVIVYDPETDTEKYVQPEYFILASAKVPGTSGLCYLEYDNGVYGSDPEFLTRGTSYPVYDFKNDSLTEELGSYNPLDYSITRGWLEGGATYPPNKHFSLCAEDFVKDLRRQYSPYLNGSFCWNDSYIGVDHVDAPVFSTVFFSLANCKIPGAKNVIWELEDSRSGVTLVKIKSENLAWTFQRAGNYNVIATVVDVNNNTKTIEKTGFVSVYETYEKMERESCPID